MVYGSKGGWSTALFSSRREINEKIIELKKSWRYVTKYIFRNLWYQNRDEGTSGTYKTLHEFRRDQTPPFDPQYIVCVCTYKNHNNNNNTHFVNTTRIPTCINTTITTAVFDIYWWNLAVKLSEWCWWRPYNFFSPAMWGWLAVIVRC